MRDGITGNTKVSVFIRTKGAGSVRYLKEREDIPLMMKGACIASVERKSSRSWEEGRFRDIMRASSILWTGLHVRIKSKTCFDIIQRVHLSALLVPQKRCRHSGSFEYASHNQFLIHLPIIFTEMPLSELPKSIPTPTH